MLNLTYLKYFCDAAKLGSVSASAKANFVTQSAISQGISKLERSLGIELVAHHPNSFRLTPVGQTVFNEALDILNRAGELKDSIKKESGFGSLDFVCTFSFAVAVIPGCLRKFQKAHQQVKINFQIGKNQEVKNMVKLGIVDFGILPNEDDLSDFSASDIYLGNLGFYTSTKCKTSDLKNMPFVLALPTSKERHLFEASYRKKFGRKPQRILEVGSWEVMANLAAAGIGIGYFPDYIYKKMKSSLQQVDLGLEVEKYTISAISAKGMKLRKSSEAFLSLFGSSKA